MKTNAQDYEIRIWYSPAPGDECFVAQVVDMPGIMAHGATREDAAREIQVALELALEVYAENGEEPPAGRNQAAAIMGRLGGSTKSKSKRLAAQQNGKKGGRPRTKVLLAVPYPGAAAVERGMGAWNRKRQGKGIRRATKLASPLKH